MKRFIGAIIYYILCLCVTWVIYGYIPGPITGLSALVLTIWVFHALRDGWSDKKDEKENK